MFINQKHIVFTLSALLLCAVNAHASYKMGGGEFFPRAAYSAVYDDNVTYSSQNELDDMINKLSIGADWELTGKTRQLTLSGDLKQDLFIDHDDFDNTSGSFVVDFQTDLSPHDRLFLNDDFSVSEDPRNFEDEFGRTTGRYRTLRNTASANYEHDFSSQWSLRSFYKNTVHDASTDTVRDSMLHNAGIDIIRAWSTRLSFLAGYEFLNRSFDSGPDSYTHGAAIGTRYSITEFLVFEARGGVDFIESFTGRDSEKPFVTASLTQALDKLSSFTLRFSKRYDTTTFSTDLFDQWRISGTYQRQLMKRWTMGLNGFVGEGKYAGTSRTDDLYGAGGHVGYDLSDNARIILGYRFAETNSTNNTSDYVKNTVTASLDYQF